jgi:hypothetical protein
MCFGLYDNLLHRETHQRQQASAQGHQGRLCTPKMLSGANAFEISNIQEVESEVALTTRP